MSSDRGEGQNRLPMLYEIVTLWSGRYRNITLSCRHGSSFCRTNRLSRMVGSSSCLRTGLSKHTCFGAVLRYDRQLFSAVRCDYQQRLSGRVGGSGRIDRLLCFPSLHTYIHACELPSWPYNHVMSVHAPLMTHLTNLTNPNPTLANLILS